MTPDIIEVLNKYGLPGWALLLIGGGTIVAAIIALVNGLIVAVINARATKRVAVYTAHREYRATVCAPMLQEVRLLAAFAVDIRRARVRSQDELATHVEQWLALRNTRPRRHTAFWRTSHDALNSRPWTVYLDVPLAPGLTSEASCCSRAVYTSSAHSMDQRSVTRTRRRPRLPLA